MNVNGKLEVKVAPVMTSNDELDDWCWENINNAKIAGRLVDDGKKWFNEHCAGKTNEQIAADYSYYAE